MRILPGLAVKDIFLLHSATIGTDSHICNGDDFSCRYGAAGKLRTPILSSFIVWNVRIQETPRDVLSRVLLEPIDLSFRLAHFGVICYPRWPMHPGRSLRAHPAANPLHGTESTGTLLLRQLTRGTEVVITERTVVDIFRCFPSQVASDQKRD